MPLANAFVRPDQLDEMEPHYPLRAFVCRGCFLVQLEAFAAPKALFSHYPYFSSYSETLLRHSKRYAELVSRRLKLEPGDRVIEIASNDGYLLQFFLGQGLDVLGIEPAANVAEAARARQVPTLVSFFGSDLARHLAAEGRRARLLVANNVFAHVPDLHDFAAGLEILLAPGGMVTLEFHHLLSLIEHGEFDNIYHEHFQYFSLATAARVLEAHGLAVCDVEELPTQGGSLRVYACRQHELPAAPSEAVSATLAKEEASGLRDLSRYEAFGTRVARVAVDVLSFVVDARRAGKSVACYGAAAKGNTLLNRCGIRADLVDYCADRSPVKQGLFLPGSRIPVVHPDRVRETRPDYLIILPWNLAEEIMAQMAYIHEWGGRFVTAIPELLIRL
jgi:SAM-dependent methyltransferase